MQPTLAEIRMFAGNFAPSGWAFCNGQILPINSNQSLFSLLDTTYGGDGETTFGLPDLRGRAPVHQGEGPGLTDHNLGQKFGSETVTLTTNQLPSHNHTMQATSNAPDANNPAGKALATGSRSVSMDDRYGSSDNAVSMGSVTTNAGGGQAHNNMQPYLAVHYIIALQGLFPSRT